MIRFPPELYSHSIGSPLDARVCAVNVCGLAIEKTKSLELMLAVSMIPGENDDDRGEDTTCVEDVDLATVVVVANRGMSMVVLPALLSFPVQVVNEL